MLAWGCRRRPFACPERPGDARRGKNTRIIWEESQHRISSSSPRRLARPGELLSLRPRRRYDAPRQHPRRQPGRSTTESHPEFSRSKAPPCVRALEPNAARSWRRVARGFFGRRSGPGTRGILGRSCGTWSRARALAKGRAVGLAERWTGVPLLGN